LLDQVIGSAAVNSFASKRMVLLEAKFQMYLLLNEDKEVRTPPNLPPLFI